MGWFLKANQIAVVKDTLVALSELSEILSILILERFSKMFSNH